MSHNVAVVVVVLDAAETKGSSSAISLSYLHLRHTITGPRCNISVGVPESPRSSFCQASSAKPPEPWRDSSSSASGNCPNPAPPKSTKGYRGYLARHLRLGFEVMVARRAAHMSLRISLSHTRLPWRFLQAAERCQARMQSLAEKVPSGSMDPTLDLRTLYLEACVHQYGSRSPHRHCESKPGFRIPPSRRREQHCGFFARRVFRPENPRKRPTIHTVPIFVVVLLIKCDNWSFMIFL